MMDLPELKGWYTPHKTPHFDAAETVQSITFRLADSLPQSRLQQLRMDCLKLPDTDRNRHQRMAIEQWLDLGMGACALRHPEVALMMTNTLHFYHGRRYQLIAWCIMPNHVHVIIKPDYSLPRIVQSWKSFSGKWAFANARRLGLQLPMQGFWMRGFWDRYIRNPQHLEVAVAYVHNNPVKAGLCAEPGQWRWSSAAVYQPKKPDNSRF